ncbi:hypothetical protein [Pelotalea chapellei]|uniref:Lipocalin-like domain-containing protein n=1 Tax=Pelotalea chapellei TaxID=44671 RepID=A0ABS5UA83_9BACT|nr:hypothetical protein [Pelotalea chapellei]MBT1072596.1 hypothetical protein [Pelotalea chapellei]
MKKSLFLLSVLIMALVLKACGGGGGGGTTVTPTPAPATVNLAAFKNVFEGTAPAGTQFNFPALTEINTESGASGSFTLAAGGAVTFEAQNVTNSLATLQLTGATAVSDTTTNYFQMSNGTPYKSVSSTGGPSLPPALPTTAKVGDSAPSTIVTQNDGSTATTSWSLHADPDGTPILLITRSFITGIATTLEYDSYYLDAAGIPTKIMISVTAGGTILTLTGNRVPS